MNFSEESDAMACKVLEKGHLYITAGLDTKCQQCYPRLGSITPRVNNIRKKPHKTLLHVLSSYEKITISGIQDILENSNATDVLSSKDALPPPAGRSHVCVT